MKKLLVCLISALLIIGMLTACSSGEREKNTEDKLSIVCTVFPLYDWTKEILGDRVSDISLTMLLDNGIDLHSFQPTADDIVKISSCDVFVYIGGESDAWVEDALKTASNGNMKAVNLMEVLSDKVVEEEYIEGMEKAEDDEHDENDVHEHEYDEHVWLSLKNASVCCKAIAEAIKSADAQNAQAYDKALSDYQEKLTALDNKYSDNLVNAKNKTFVVADRYPFRYLFEDYGFDCFAAFSGCSAETEASFETIAFLAGKVDELGLDNILVLDSGDGKIAGTIIENTKNKNQKILKLDSMQSTTAADAASGATYLSSMENNLRTLAEAAE